MFVYTYAYNVFAPVRFMCNPILSYLAKYVSAVVGQAQVCPQLLIVLAQPVQLQIGLQHLALLVLDKIALCCTNVFGELFFLLLWLAGGI